MSEKQEFDDLSDNSDEEECLLEYSSADIKSVEGSYFADAKGMDPFSRHSDDSDAKGLHYNPGDDCKTGPQTCEASPATPSIGLGDADGNLSSFRMIQEQARQRYSTTSSIFVKNTLTSPNTEQILFW